MQHIQQSILPTDHTFVVCAYGESPYLEDCVRSVVRQTVPSNVLLSTSTQNEFISKIAAKYSLPLYINPGKGDMQDNWNFGISCAKTPFVTVCHQDDYYHECYFYRVRQHFTANTLMIHTSYWDVQDGVAFHNPNNRIRCLLNFPMRYRIFQGMRIAKKNALRFGNSICCPSCTYHVRKLGLPVFSSKLRHGLDWDTYIDMASRPGRMAYIAQPLCYKRTHAASATVNDIQSGLREKEDRYLFGRLWPKPIANWMLLLYKRIYKYSV